MNLRSKKILSSKALGVGMHRIHFDPERLAEIKEAITKQDIHSLKQDGIIKIKPAHGRKKIVRRKRRRSFGKIKIKLKSRKRDYINITRKLRRYLKGLKQRGDVDRETYQGLRKKIRTRTFKSLANFKDYIAEINKSGLSVKTKQKSEKKGQAKVSIKHGSKTKGAKAK